MHHTLLVFSSIVYILFVSFFVRYLFDRRQLQLPCATEGVFILTSALTVPRVILSIVSLSRAVSTTEMKKRTLLYKKGKNRKKR